MRRFELPLPLQILLLAGAYTIVARLGLDLHAVGGFATLVWPPSGIAIAAVLLLGPRVWPGIWLGAAAVNLWVGAPPLVAAGMATGNTLEALVAGWALRRLPDFDSSLERPRDVLALTAVAALAATTVSATIGVTSLYLGGSVATAGLAVTWHTWWIGDALGVLVVAPLLLTFASRSQAPARRPLEVVALIATVVGGSLLIFNDVVIGDPALQRAYLLFPVLLWAAIRFGPRGASAATFLVCTIAVAMTARGHGPFVYGDLTSSLLGLQLFVGFTSTVFLVAAAMASEALRRRRELQSALGSVQVAREQAERASQAKTAFLNLVSHELRTPLTALYLQAERLRRDDQTLDADQRELVAGIQQQSSRLTEMIHGLLEHAQIQRGRLTVQIEPFDPRALALVCVDDIRLQAEARALTVSLEAGRLPPFAGDARLVRLILTNLVSNAVKFTSTGSVRVRLSLVGGGALQLAVTDTGPGIPRGELPRIFEPFEQLDPDRHWQPGLGLGLALVRQITRALGGEVNVESEVGAGSTFTVVLPPASEHTPREIDLDDRGDADEAER